MSNTSKFDKKTAIVCSFWGGLKDTYEKYAVWSAEAFSQMGVEEIKALVFRQIPGRGEIKEHGDYMEVVHDLAKWLVQ